MTLPLPARPLRFKLVATLAICLLFFSSLAPTSALADDTASISGYVHNAATGAPLPGANINLVNHPAGTSSDTSGFFSLTNLSPGRYRLVCSYVGHKTYKTSFRLSTEENLQVTIPLSPAKIRVGEIVVRPDKLPSSSNKIGSYRLAPGKAAQVPVLLGDDLLRSLRTLPGVSGASDFSSELYIRGSAPGQTLVQLDGMTVYNPGHFLGFFSPFNPDAVDHLRLYKGAYPSQFGGRLGSVLTIEQKAGSPHNFQGKLNVGLLASRAQFEGPHPGGSWMLAARRSTMEPTLWVLNQHNVAGTPKAFHFYDLNGKLLFGSVPGANLSLAFYAARDQMNFPFQKNLLFDIAYRTHAARLRWTQPLTKQLSSKVSVVANRYFSDSHGRLSRIPYSRSMRLMHLSAKSRLAYQPNSRYKLRLGLQARYRRFEVTDTHLETQTLNRSRPSRQGTVFWQNIYRPTVHWKLRLGARGYYYRPGPYLKVAPKAAVTYHPTASLSFQVAAGRYHQFLTLSRNQAISSFNAWLPAAPNVPPAYGDQLTAGTQLTPLPGVSVGLEAYYRSMNGLFKLNPRLTDKTNQPYQGLFQTGDGYAFGSELFLRRTAGSLTGHVGYTYSQTWRRFPNINANRFFPPRYDRRHKLNLAVHLQLTSRWRLSGTFVYTSGQPFTQPVAQYLLMDSPYMGHKHDILVAPVNNARLPPYHRLDLGASHRGHLFSGVNYQFQLQLINVLNHRNIWFYLFAFDRRYSLERLEIPQIPIMLPNLSITLEFL